MDEIRTPDKSFDVVLYDLKEMEQILGVTKRTIMNYIYNGKLKAAKIGGKWKVTKEVLEAFCRGEQ